MRTKIACLLGIIGTVAGSWFCDHLPLGVGGIPVLPPEEVKETHEAPSAIEAAEPLDHERNIFGWDYFRGLPCASGGTFPC